MTEVLAASDRHEICAGLRLLRETFALASPRSEVLCAFLSRTIDALLVPPDKMAAEMALRGLLWVDADGKIGPSRAEIVDAVLAAAYPQAVA